MRVLVANSWLRGSLRLPDGSQVREVAPGSEFMADDDNAARLLRKGAAVEKPAPKRKKKKAKPAEEA